MYLPNIIICATLNFKKIEILTFNNDNEIY